MTLDSGVLIHLTQNRMGVPTAALGMAEGSWLQLPCEQNSLEGLLFEIRKHCLLLARDSPSLVSR